MKTEKTRPVFVLDKHLTYLDNLRESGATNMLGAGAYIESEFDLPKIVAREILSYWMETFGKTTR